jgi:hypothetical protein
MLLLEGSCTFQPGGGNRAWISFRPWGYRRLAIGAGTGLGQEEPSINLYLIPSMCQQVSFLMIFFFGRTGF